MPLPPAGPGDDAALVDPHLVTTDSLVEGVHFQREEPSFLTGRKSLSVSLSDIAAMGGQPRACLLALAVPADLPFAWIDSFNDGFASAAAGSGVAWVGGDTVRSPCSILVSVTLLGTCGARVLTRSGAHPGDGIYVTGPLGASAAGRWLLTDGWRVSNPTAAVRRRRVQGASGAPARFPGLVPPGRGGKTARGGTARRLPTSIAAVLLESHLDPIPRLAEGSFLSGEGLASAALDLSDGLSLDLARLCEASGTGAELLREAIPVSAETRQFAAFAGADPFDLAVHGGEDYELLFTTPRRLESRLARWPVAGGSGAFRIGRICSPDKGIRVVDSRGRASRLMPGGYDAFSGRRSAAGRGGRR
jgi:thiamine-monophosphate kinase